MEFLNPTTRTHSEIFSKTNILFSPKYQFTTRRNKNPSNPNILLSKFPLFPSFPLKFPRNVQVSAHFGRPTNRKNYLRKKLTQSQHQQQQQQVTQTPTIYNPSSDFENPVDNFGDNNSSDSQLNFHDFLVNWGSKNTSFGAGENELHGMDSDEVEVPSLKSVFRNELKSWVDQYKADSEFWGIGSGPIFTVSKNSDGKVEHVDVNEDEILRRSQLEPLLYKVNEAQNYKEVNSKIGHARFLAREMENGNNVLSKDSSVAKFVNSGGELGSFRMIRGLTIDKPGVFSKQSIIGVTVLCGLVLILGSMRFFTAKGGKKRYSRSEKEMLRRKMKAWMEREKLVKGSVEVMQDSKQPEIVFTERPQLDKRDLLDAIMKVKGENGNLGSQLMSDTRGSDARDFASKIEEIRVMARHARKIEKTDTLQGGSRDEEDGQIVSDISNEKEVVEIKSTFLDDLLEDDTERSQLDKQDLTNTIDDSSVHPRSQPIDFDFGIDEIGALASNARETERTDSSAGDCSDVEDEPTVNGFSNEKKVTPIKSTSLDDLQVDDTKTLGKTPYPRSSKSKYNPVRAKPKIIKTVKEAREYLSQKRDKREQNEETKVRTVQEVDSDVNIQSKTGNFGSQLLADTRGSNSMDFASKIVETRGMDGNAPNIEQTESFQGNNGDEEDSQTVNVFSNEKDVIEIKSTSLDDPLANGHERSHLMNTSDDLASKIPSDTPTSQSIDSNSEIEETGEMAGTDWLIERKDSSAGDISKGKEEHRTVNGFPKKVRQIKSRSLDDPLVDDSRTLGETPSTRSNKPENAVRAKPRIIKSVKEAREYLSQKYDKREQSKITKVRTVQEIDTNVNIQRKGVNGGATSQKVGKNGPSESTNTTYASGVNTLKKEKLLGNSKKGTTPIKNDKPEDGVEGVINHENSDEIAKDVASGDKEKWIEKNFHEFEPIINKIRIGFQENYKVAREKVNEDANFVKEMVRPEPDEDDDELDWMKDDKLSEIVFKVRENELLGRDPFHLMDGEDKRMFFEGLEKKVEKVNEKLANLHQWLQSNVENLNYGADGISVHDPPEKIIPRWKGPPLDTTPAVLDDYVEQRKALFSGSLSNSNLVKRDGQDSVQKSQESPSHDNTAGSSAVDTRNEKFDSKDLKSSKTIVEGSDGSVRAGKKSGKEFWEHTKKWSRGFLECYNAENDPETKAAMKDIGKDLDRWITEKEIQDAADLMKKVPEKGQKFIQEKIEKVKREMEMYGPHAVVSKYSEYAEEKEVDYFWWLDLPFVMCIELYMDEDGENSKGLYSLEMGADLELEPKPYHVIAFEDATDCRNLCHIIQFHMNMRGNGNAFVVVQQPKDAYREAHANGFNVTVIRKGELKLNVDQTLEEVEEQITEIGSKMYHDRITRGRSVDMQSLMKGVFGVEKPTQRKRSKRRLKKPKK